jgi:spermidine synthase
LGIGVLGIALLFAVPRLGSLYAAITPGGISGILLRGILSVACLLPPTMLMGATLPAISRFVKSTANGVSQLGLVYGSNTLGAVCGALVAGFYLLRIHDVITATLVAAGLNGAIAIIGLTIRVRASSPERVEPPEPVTTPDLNHGWPVYTSIIVSGFCALGAEVVWTRLLSLMLGGTTYTFSIILAVFLAGLAAGNGVGAFLARQTSKPQVLFGACQLLLAGAIAWAACMLSRSLPYWPINPVLSKSIWITFQVDFLRCLWAIFPATCLWGASFPLALAAVVQPGQDPGQLVGRLYAANTLGAIAGAVGCSVVMIAWLGTQQTQRLLIILSALAGLVLLIPRFARVRAGNSADKGIERWKTVLAQTTYWLLASGAVAVLAWSVLPVPWTMVAYGRYLDEDRARESFVRRGGHERFGGGDGARHRSPEFSCQRQNRGVHGFARHVPATDARTHPVAVSSRSAFGPGGRLRCRGHCRRIPGSSRHRTDYAL